ncbi:MAG: peptidase M28, partial [Sphingomonas sp. 12-62-6]
MRAALLPILLAATASNASAQTKPDISLDTLKTVTQTLSSDAYEGRAPATPAEDKTVAYLIERFKAAGLKPANNGSWVQDVPLVEILATDVSPMTIAGGKAPVTLAYRQDMVIAT